MYVFKFLYLKGNTKLFYFFKFPFIIRENFLLLNKVVADVMYYKYVNM